MEVQFADQAPAQDVATDNPDPPDAPPNEMDTALLMIGSVNACVLRVSRLSTT
jgi:hypothetical protein